MNNRMQRYVLTAAGLLFGSVVLAGCAVAATPATVTDVQSDSTATTAVVVDATLTAEAVLAENENSTTVNDDEWSRDSAVSVDLSNPSTADGVTVSGSTVTITAAGTYVLNGDLDGQVVVAAPDDAVVAIVLSDATIDASDGPAIWVQGADDVAISLEGDNSVSDASSYADDADANAAIFSEADLTISGSGSLTVSGNGGDGITSEDDLVVLSGSITVDAADDALRGKDSLVVKDGDLTLTAGGDALLSDNEEDATRGYVWIDGGTIDATSGDDGIDAVTDVVLTGGSLTVDATGKGVKAGVYLIAEGTTASVTAQDDALHSNGAIHLNLGDVAVASGDDGLHADSAIVIDGGSLTVTQSYEGIEAPSITINDGDVTVRASDDGINASGNSTATEGGGMGGGMGDTGELLTIAGGTVLISADGDGFDSNGSAVVSGGTLIVNGPTNDGNGALDVNGTLTVSGGTVFAIGSSGMAVSPDASSPQSWISATVSGAAGDVVQVLDSSGAVVYEYTAEKSFSSVVFSSSVLADGANYSVTVNGSSPVTVTEGTAAAGGNGGPGEGGMRP
ncbi:carbohydrate-binding domain-containing protein [Schumannella luteola]